MKKNRILTLTLLFISFFIISCNKNNSYSIIQATEPLNITNKSLKAASAVESVLFDDKIYYTYLASEDKYGEQRDLVMLGVYSISDESFFDYIVAKNDEYIYNMYISYPFEPNIMIFDDKIRVFFINNSTNKEKLVYCFRDFNIEDSTFSEVKIMKFTLNDKTIDFSYNNYNEIFYNYSDTIYDFNYPIFTGNISKSGDVYISTITSSCWYPIVVSSMDGFQNFKIETILDEVVKHESSILHYGRYYYVINRSEKNNFMILNESFEIIKSYSLEISSTRPRIYELEGKIYLFYSDYTSKGITSGRNNMIISVYNPLNKQMDLNIFKEENYNGIVYYNPIFIESKKMWYVIYSTNIYNMNNQAKDALFLKKYSMD